MTNFIFLGYKITTNNERSHEIKTLASWKESYDQCTQHIKKQRHHFSDEIKAVIFPVAMYRSESRTIKKTEHQELMVLEFRGESFSVNLDKV